MDQHRPPQRAGDAVSQGADQAQQAALEQEARIVEQEAPLRIPEAARQGVIQHEQAGAQRDPGPHLQRCQPGQGMGQQQPPEQQLLAEGGHQRSGHAAPEQAGQRRPAPGARQQTIAPAEPQGQRRIDRQEQQRPGDAGGLRWREQGVAEAGHQGAGHRQLAQKDGGCDGLQAGISAGDLVGAQQLQGQAGPEQFGREAVVSAARQQRPPAEQHIQGLLTGLERPALARQHQAAVVHPVGAHPAEGGEQMVESQAQPSQTLALGRAGRHDGLPGRRIHDRDLRLPRALLLQLLQGDPQGLGGILHAGGGGGHQGHPPAVAAAVARRQQLRLQGDGIEHLRAERDQRIGEGARAEPAALQIAAVGTPVLAAGDDAVGIVGIDLVVPDLQARLAAERILHHAGLAEGEVAGDGPARDRFAISAADAAEQMHQQGPIARLPLQRGRPVRQQGGAGEGAADQLRRTPAAAQQPREAGLGAADLLPGPGREQGARLERLSGEHAVGGGGSLDPPALAIRLRSLQPAGIEHPPAEAVGWQQRHADRLARTIETTAPAVVVTHPPQTIRLAVVRTALEAHQSLPAAADLHRRPGDAHLVATALHTLQKHRQVIGGPGPRQRLQRPYLPAAVEAAGHHIAASGRAAGGLSEADVGGDSPHQALQRRILGPEQAQAPADPVLGIGRGLLQLDPHPVLARGHRAGQLLRGRENQPAEPLGTGAVKISAGPQAERIALWPTPGGLQRQGLAAHGQRLGGGAHGRRRGGRWQPGQPAQQQTAGQDERQNDSLDAGQPEPQTWQRSPESARSHRRPEAMVADLAHSSIRPG